MTPQGRKSQLGLSTLDVRVKEKGFQGIRRYLGSHSHSLGIAGGENE